MKASQLWIFAIFSGAIALSSAVAAQPTWVILGDSWGVQIAPIQEEELRARGREFPIVNLAEYGTTARAWATDSAGLLSGARETLAGLPEESVALIYVILGGNDVLERWPQAGESVYDEVRTDLETISRALLEAKPNSRVFLASYDLLNFRQSLFCWGLAISFFGSGKAADVNNIFINGTDVVEPAADIDPRVYAFNLMGALQGSPGSPNPNRWSPAEYMSLNPVDCIHLNVEGYRIFTSDMFDEIQERLLGGG